MTDQKIFKQMLTNELISIDSLSRQRGVLLVFLRHFGCIFCREAILDLQKISHRLDEANIDIVFIHMGSEEIAIDYFNKSGFKNAKHIGDPNCQFYEIFGLGKGDFRQLNGFRSLLGTARALTKGLKMEKPTGGDVHQMPGVFFVKDSKIINSYFHKSVGSRPNYLKLCSLQ